MPTRITKFLLPSLLLLLVTLTGCEVDGTDVPLWAQALTAVPFGGAILWIFSLAGRLLSERVKHAYWSRVTARGVDAVGRVVGAIQQTYVDELKAASADGRLTPEEVAMIREATLNRAKSYLGVKGLKELATVFEIPVDQWISDEAETQVKKLRLEQTAAEKAAPVNPS